jgi:hypothetical protein
MHPRRLKCESDLEGRMETNLEGGGVQVGSESYRNGLACRAVQLSERNFDVLL